MLRERDAQGWTVLADLHNAGVAIDRSGLATNDDEFLSLISESGLTVDQVDLDVDFSTHSVLWMAPAGSTTAACVKELQRLEIDHEEATISPVWVGIEPNDARPDCSEVQPHQMFVSVESAHLPTQPFELVFGS